MAEENYDLESGNTDDVSALRQLLHTLRGLSPVSSNDFVIVPAEDESETST